jgi:tRNA(fMet)-specific endonuclease VapC
MKYMLDTDIFSYLVENVQPVIQRFIALNDGDACISAITCGEVHYGIHRNNIGKVRRERIQVLLEQLPIAAVDDSVAEIYARLRSTLEKNGQPIGPNDYWIAAHAISLGATLVTNNVREFKRIKGLKVDNWLK